MTIKLLFICRYRTHKSHSIIIICGECMCLKDSHSRSWCGDWLWKLSITTSKSCLPNEFVSIVHVVVLSSSHHHQLPSLPSFDIYSTCVMSFFNYQLDMTNKQNKNYEYLVDSLSHRCKDNHFNFVCLFQFNIDKVRGQNRAWHSEILTLYLSYIVFIFFRNNKKKKK